MSTGIVQALVEHYYLVAGTSTTGIAAAVYLPWRKHRAAMADMRLEGARLDGRADAIESISTRRDDSWSQTFADDPAKAWRRIVYDVHHNASLVLTPIGGVGVTDPSERARPPCSTATRTTSRRPLRLA